MYNKSACWVTTVGQSIWLTLAPMQAQAHAHAHACALTHTNNDRQGNNHLF